jgi:hypothetical protein
MASQLHLVSERGGLKRTAGTRSRNGWHEAVLEHAIDVADAERTENENLGPHPGFAKDDGLLDVGARENRRTCLLQRETNGSRSMTIGIGLDDRDDARRTLIRVTVRLKPDPTVVMASILLVMASILLVMASILLVMASILLVGSAFRRT